MAEQKVKLQIADIGLSFGGVAALSGVSLDVKEDEILAIIGPNGAGKTTTLKAISGLLKTEEGEATDGTIAFDDVRIEHKGPEEIVKLDIVQVNGGSAHLQVPHCRGEPARGQQRSPQRRHLRARPRSRLPLLPSPKGPPPADRWLPLGGASSRWS